jgi:hypothetical protein
MTLVVAFLLGAAFSALWFSMRVEPIIWSLYMRIRSLEGRLRLKEKGNG